MFAFPTQWFSPIRITTLLIVTVGYALLGSSLAFGQAQSNAADLRGFVRDATGAVVTNATVTARNPATNTSKDATTNGDGYYQIVNLTPGDYEVTVEAPNFKKAVLPAVKLTVGQNADLDVALEVGQVSEVVTISGATTELVETSKTAVATTVDQQRIDNLPINERNYLAFALTTSTVSRDNGRPIGPAPTTGLNFGGQRGRSNLVQVDGADNTDNSVNAARSTVSQEAVQEFQVVTNSFAPEFGRSSGGVVNVVTKSGTNDFRGNVFGFLRDKSFQARNPFAPIAKPAFRRTQYGVTLGGPFDRDRTFFFFAFEQRRRDESGFFTSNVAQGLTASVTLPPLAPGFPAQTVRNLRPEQASYINGLLGSGIPALINAGVQYAYLAGSGSATALTGSNPLLSTGSVPGVTPGTPVGSRFFLTGLPVPNSSIAFRPLNELLRIFPVTDRTTYNSFRLDHAITKDHLFNFRFGYNPSQISGIQVESQNQSLGQNDFSRTGIQKLRDFSAVSSLTSTLSSTMVNELRFNFGERRATFRSQNGDAVAFNISDTAFIGRELFSPVVRTETRYEWTDNLNLVAGNHTLKFGGDIAFVRIPEATFELNFAGLFNFGGLSATTLAAFPTVPGIGAPPDFTPVQQYGLGFPGSFIQGYGNPVSRIANKPLAFFAQDSWKIRPNLTLNYGVRYDYEVTDQISTVPFTDPLSGINLSAADLLAAQGVLNVQQGFPRDKNNWAPRLAVAWDPQNNGKTVIRAAFGIFYDHPLLAVAFNSDIGDAAQQQQSTLISGSPDFRQLLNAVQVFQGSVVVCNFPGARPGVNCTPGAASSAEYQAGRQRFNDQTFPGFGTLLPFTLPVKKDFEYAYANQGNFGVERQITKNMSLSASYLFVGAHHLPLPIDVNVVRGDLLVANFQRFANRGPTSFGEAVLATSFPTAPGTPGSTPGSSFTNSFTGETFVTIIPGFIVQGPRGRVVSPAAVNFFRPSGPNYFLVQAFGVPKSAFDANLAGSLATPTSVIAPFGDVNAQSSIGNSLYHALNVDLKRRFSNNIQFLASYTWSHSIDDSSDLQTLLKPQDNRNLRLDRADSLFDQRHRFVFSGLVTSPAAWRHSDSGARRFLADFTLAPIFEMSSGRPFNILSGVDQNFDLQGTNERPSVAADGTLCVPGPTSSICPAALPVNGSLGRNTGITHRYADLDMRLMRSIPFGERRRLDIIAEGFNLFNRFNEAAAAPFFTAVNAFGRRAGNGRYFSRPTASFDPRQFQFGLKLNF
ncbi:MAG: TonB-dependent receptor [Acidobacteriota bacterium]|nr:TonB-dependent receptor [Acidobacteriota bacterium]